MGRSKYLITDRIDPRPMPPKESATCQTAWDAYNVGNYPEAFYGTSSEDLELCALTHIMCGAIRLGLGQLRSVEFLSDEAKLIQSYAQWCLDEDQELANHFSDSPHEPIDILVFTMPNSRLNKAFKKLSGFNIHLVQITAEQFGVPIGIILSQLPEKFTPKAAITIDCYGPYLPHDLHKVDFPLIFWVADHDFFFSTRFRDLSIADVIIVNSASEHSEICQFYNGRVAALPAHDTLEQGEDAGRENVKRSIDILFTGRAYVPYMRDKAQQLFRLASIEDENIIIEIYDGYFDRDSFYKKISSAKAIPLFWRYGGGFQTRAIDALRHGATVFFPDNGICRNLLGSHSGYYQSIGTRTPEVDMIKHLENFDNNIIPNKYSDSSDIQEIFWETSKREERFLKFCLLQTSYLINKRQNALIKESMPVELRGYGVQEGLNVYTSIMKKNMEDPNSASHFNYAGSAGFYSSILAQNRPKIASLSLQCFDEGVMRYPNNLVLRFNYARALWIFGQLERAYIEFTYLNDENISWDFDPRSDALLSHRIRDLSEMFPYGDYYRSVVGFETASDDLAVARHMIIATAKTYLAKAAINKGEINEALEMLKEASRLCPINYAIYRLLVLALYRNDEYSNELLEAFYAGVNLYPPLLFELLPYGLEVSQQLGQNDCLREILKKFILVYARSFNPDDTSIEIPKETKLAVKRYKHFLSGWTKNIANQMVASGRI